MQDTPAPHSEPRSQRPPRAKRTGAQIHPSSSRMLTNYLADLEQNLDEQRWDMALRDAIDLPQIAVALADPALLCSSDRCKEWCTEWITPGHSANDGAICQETLCRIVEEHASGAESVPSAALRSLRLRRHARNAPRGFNSTRVGEDADTAATFALCTAVVEGVRRWYANSGCHDAVAQANLARLAVLR